MTTQVPAAWRAPVSLRAMVVLQGIPRLIASISNRLVMFHRTLAFRNDRRDLLPCQA